MTSCPPTAGSCGRRPSRPRRPRSPGRARRSPRMPGSLASADVALGDRTNMLFQNTSVTRGTATLVVTATGMQTADGPDRDDAHLGDAHPVAPAARAGLADQGARHHRVGGGRRHRRRRPDPRDAGRPAAAARHGDGHLGDPDRHAGLRLGPAVDGLDAAGRCQGGRQEPHRRRDARCDERDQHRQDRHADAEPDDGLDAVRRRLVVHRRRRGVPQDRRHPVGRRRAGPGLHPPRAGARPRQRRRRRGRRRR